MKQALIATMLCLSLAVGSMQAQRVQVVKTDTVGIATATVTMNDSLFDGQHRTDSMRISMNGQESAAAKQEADIKGLLGIPLDGEATEAIVIVLIVFGCIVALPVLIVFFSMRYKYKMRREECMMAARALDKGQPLPDIMFKKRTDNDLRAKGIRNIALGLGLAFLLGFVCDASLSTIGVFILLMGVGQVVTYYTRPKWQEVPPEARPEAQDILPVEAQFGVQDRQVEHSPSSDDNTFGDLA